MGLFRNKQESSEVVVSEPAPQRSWVVWLLSVVTFFLTVAIVLGLFWAGRWVVQQFTKAPAGTPVTTPTKPIAAPPQATINNNRDSAGRSTAPSSNNNSGSTTAPSTPAPAPTPTTPKPTTTPSTGPTLVNTGPTSDE